MQHRQALVHELKHYTTSYPEERNFIQCFLDLLGNPRCFHRDHLPGHITGSAWILDETGEYVLLTHHAKLDRWLQPGGHADGEEDVQSVALREATEETGLKNIQVALEGIFDIDIHTIPARKDFPEHLHYDIRYCFRANRQDRLVITDESHDLKWVPLSNITEFTTGASILRMCSKIETPTTLLTPNQ